MKLAFGILTAFILNIVLLFFLGSSSSQAATLVEGDSDALKLITYTSHLDGQPVLLFSEQVGKDARSLVNKVDSVVLSDSTWQDLAVEFAVESEIFGAGAAITVSKRGNYEFYVARDQVSFASSGQMIDIDGKKLPWVEIDLSKRIAGKYIELANTALGKGTHSIKVGSDRKDLRILLVNREKRRELEEDLSRVLIQGKKEATFIFSQDGEFYSKKGETYFIKLRVVEQEETHESPTGKDLGNLPLLKVDGQGLPGGTYKGKEKQVSGSEAFWYELNGLRFSEGKHNLALLATTGFKVDLAVIEPQSTKESRDGLGPEIVFKRINPTKYLVAVRGAREPFWLVLSEGFNTHWRAYTSELIGGAMPREFRDTVASYPRVKVSEARHLTAFTPADLRYLFRGADIDEHFVVNSYANGWHVDPRKMGLGSDFTIVLYFWPQSLFYLGLFVSATTLLCSLAYLLWSRRMNVKSRVLR